MRKAPARAGKQLSPLEELRADSRETRDAIQAFQSAFEVGDQQSRERDATLMHALSELDREVRRHAAEIAALRGVTERHDAEIDCARTEILALRDGTSALRGEMAELKDHVALLSHNVAILNGNLAALQSGVAAFREESRQHSDEIRELRSSVHQALRKAGEAKDPPPA